MKNISMAHRVLLLFFLVLGLQNVQGQNAYEGKGENKISVAWAYYGRDNGLSLMYDHGFSDLISAGGGIETYVIEGDREVSVFAMVDFHLNKVLNLPERLDIFPGVEAGSFIKEFELFGYVGISYAISEKIGLYTEIGNRGTLGVYLNL